MSLPDDNKPKDDDILADAQKLFGFDPIGEELKLFSTLTALNLTPTWRDRLRDSFFQLILPKSFTENGKDQWRNRLLSWEKHLDAYFQIADRKSDKEPADGQKIVDSGAERSGSQTGGEATENLSRAESTPAAAIPLYSLAKHGTDRLVLLFDHLKIIDGKFSMLLTVNSVIVALVGLSLKETTDLFAQMRSLGTFGASWLQWPILGVLGLTIGTSFFNIWYAIRGFRRIVWGNLGKADSTSADRREQEYARSLMLSLARRTNVFRIVAYTTRWAIGFFMTFAVLAGAMFLLVFVHPTPQSYNSSAQCTASPHCCCANSQPPQPGAAGTSPATVSVTIGNLGLTGDHAKDGLYQDTTLHLSTKLEDALTGYLKNGNSSAGDSLFSGGRGVALFLLLAAGAGLAAWAIRKRPAIAAPLGATGLAAAVIKNPGHLSHLSWWGFLVVLILFSAVSIVLLILSGIEFRRRLTPRDEEGGESDGKQPTEKKSVESPLNIVFSLAVLIWAVIIACYHTEPIAAPPAPPTPGGPVSTIPKIPHAITLGAVSGFLPYSAKIEDLKADQLDALMGRLTKNGAGPGDLLLLLGSADCTAVHAKNMSNELLAKNRANSVLDMLSRSGTLAGEDVWTDSLYQHERCHESKDMRAVFPVLIHMKPGNPVY